jgi:uncharacterized protein
MEILITAIVAFLTSVLTFFSGFGLGTILMVTLLLFFPPELAIGMTALVHFTSNLLKIGLVFPSIEWRVWLRFGLPAMFASFLGAYLLIGLQHLPDLYSYRIGDRTFVVTSLKLILSVFILLIALDEFVSIFGRMRLTNKMLMFGGMLSGFLGGLTGMQGAVRSAFLIKAGLGKEAYIATGVAIACVIDVSRIAVYGFSFDRDRLQEHWVFILAVTLAALAGVLVGKRLLKKVSLKTVRNIVGIMLILVAIALGMGFI